MNVRQAMEVVNISVIMRLDHFIVNAMMGICWKVMGLDAWVSLPLNEQQNMTIIIIV